MKKLLIGLLLVVLCGIGISTDAAGPSRIVGLSSECDTNNIGCIVIPLTMSTLCTGATCPFRSSFSYTDSTRFWGSVGSGTGACITSTNGGTTWNACTAQPFVTGANELYAGASDGSVIALGTTTGPTTCTFRRSTDNAVNWSTTFTLAVDCNPGNNEGQYLYCLNNGICEAALNNSNLNTFRIFRSSDNGQNWTTGETGSASCGTGAGSVWNGSSGIIPSMDPGCGGGNLATAFNAVTDTWTVSTAWTGTQGSCWGQVIISNVGYASCGSAITYGFYTSTGATFRTFVLPGATLAVNNGGVAFALDSTVIYVFATATVPAGIGAYVSRDAGVTFGRLGTETSGGGAGIRGGNAFFANGCVYWSGGTTTRRFAKIC